MEQIPSRYHGLPVMFMFRPKSGGLWAWTEYESTARSYLDLGYDVKALYAVPYFGDDDEQRATEHAG
jgi:hypothetical protein